MSGKTVELTPEKIAKVGNRLAAVGIVPALVSRTQLADELRAKFPPLCSALSPDQFDMLLDGLKPKAGSTTPDGSAAAKPAFKPEQLDKVMALLPSDGAGMTPQEIKQNLEQHQPRLCTALNQKNQLGLFCDALIARIRTKAGTPPDSVVDRNADPSSSTFVDQDNVQELLSQFDSLKQRLAGESIPPNLKIRRANDLATPIRAHLVREGYEGESIEILQTQAERKRLKGEVMDNNETLALALHYLCLIEARFELGQLGYDYDVSRRQFTEPAGLSPDVKAEADSWLIRWKRLDQILIKAKTATLGPAAAQAAPVSVVPRPPVAAVSSAPAQQTSAEPEAAPSIFSVLNIGNISVLVSAPALYFVAGAASHGFRPLGQLFSKVMSPDASNLAAWYIAAIIPVAAVAFELTTLFRNYGRQKAREEAIQRITSGLKSAVQGKTDPEEQNRSISTLLKALENRGLLADLDAFVSDERIMTRIIKAAGLTDPTPVPRLRAITTTLGARILAQSFATLATAENEGTRRVDFLKLYNADPYVAYKLEDLFAKSPDTEFVRQVDDALRTVLIEKGIVQGADDSAKKADARVKAGKLFDDLKRDYFYLKE